MTTREQIERLVDALINISYVPEVKEREAKAALMSAIRSVFAERDALAKLLTRSLDPAVFNFPYWDPAVFLRKDIDAALAAQEKP